MIRITNKLRTTLRGWACFLPSVTNMPTNPAVAKKAAPQSIGVEWPFVSVIMPVRDESEYIEQSLRAVLDQDYPDSRMEILVVDGMSADNTRPISTHRFIRSMVSPNLQKAPVMMAFSLTPM